MCSAVQKYHNLFSQSPFDGHLRLPVFIFTNEDALNTLVDSTMSHYICWLFLEREWFKKR